MAAVGGIKDVKGFHNSTEVEELARYAVNEYNNKEYFSTQNALLELIQVVKAREQVVAGTIYYLTLEVKDAGIKKLYEAKIWVKPWMNFKELQEFKPIGNSIQGKKKSLLPGGGSESSD